MYDQAIKIDPKYAPAFINKGKILLLTMNRKFVQEVRKIRRSY